MHCAVWNIWNHQPTVLSEQHVIVSVTSITTYLQHIVCMAQGEFEKYSKTNKSFM